MVRTITRKTKRKVKINQKMHSSQELKKGAISPIALLMSFKFK
jgi:hypothetical protein